jgi:hypothetical protein
LEEDLMAVAEVHGMNLVIVAGGLGSRLAPVTNYVPKFLVNIGKQTGYVEMLRYWTQYSKFGPAGNEDIIADLPGHDWGSLTVIVHSLYKDVVEAYHAMYFPQIPLIVKTVDVANGSAHAILSTCDHLAGKPVWFTWCDVLPVDELDLEAITETYFGANVVYTNYNNSNRYGLVRESHGWADVVPAIAPEQDGGCFGLYYISRYKPDSIVYENGQDFIEIIRQFGKIREQKIANIIDFGDTPKLIRTRSKADEAREFNSITYVDDYVLKAATNPQGEKILEKEIKWYEKIGKIGGLAVPSTWVAPDRRSFFMSKVEGVPIWKAWPEFSPVDRHFVLSQVIEFTDKLYEAGRFQMPMSQVLTDVRAEAEGKLKSRYLEIKDMIAAFGPVTVVNGVHIHLEPLEAIAMLGEALKNHYLKEAGYDDRNSLMYGYIHGDLQMSNAMVNLETRKVTIIDPRGYFGLSSIHGLKDYDTGKLLYALSGYDLFNYSKTFGIDRLGYEDLPLTEPREYCIDFKIPKPSHCGIEDIMNERFSQVHQLWLAVCWLGLAQYIKNDPVKSVCAHYHGMVLAQQALDSRW